MYYNEAMSSDTTIRSVRMYDDAWDLVSARSRNLSMFVRDMTDAGMDAARCYTCFELVPVEFGDLTGRPLAEWVTEAQKTVTRQHRDGHHPVTVGRGTAAQTQPPAGEPAGEPDQGATLVFREPLPDAVPVATFPVPEVPGRGSKRGKRAS